LVAFSSPQRYPLCRRGWLHLVYCHFMSMMNWTRLIDLKARPTAEAG
jgi:hypothetical protein